MKPIRTRAELLSLISGRAPSRACERAIRENRTKVLGGFAPPKGIPYFLVRIESAHGAVWYVKIFVNEEGRKYPIEYHRDTEEKPFEPDWEHWSGKANKSRIWNVINGDDPAEMQHRRIAHGTAATTFST